MKEYIYKLTCKTSTGDVDTFYVGRSKNLEQRYKRHLKDFKYKQNRKCYDYIRKFHKVTKETFKVLIEMEMLEEVEYVETKTVRIRERHWIENLDTLKKGNERLPNGCENPAEYKKRVQGHRIYCPICAKSIVKKNISSHNKTKKHLKLKEVQTNLKISLNNDIFGIIREFLVIDRCMNCEKKTFNLYEIIEIRDSNLPDKFKWRAQNDCVYCNKCFKKLFTNEIESDINSNKIKFKAMSLYFSKKNWIRWLNPSDNRGVVCENVLNNYFTGWNGF